MATTLSTTIYEYAPEADSGFMVGSTSAALVGMYGKVPTAQRAYTSILITSNIVSSTAFGAAQTAQLQEVVNILKAVGLCASA